MHTVSKATIIRTAVLMLSFINLKLSMAGKSPLPFDDEEFTTMVSLALTTGASLWAWWKNNSFTQKAIKADEMLQEELENNG